MPTLNAAPALPTRLLNYGNQPSPKTSVPLITKQKYLVKSKDALLTDLK